MQNFIAKASFSPQSTDFVIQNTKAVIDTLNKLSNLKGAKSLSTYDFSSLYTNTPHDKLIKTLHSLIDFA